MTDAPGLIREWGAWVVAGASAVFAYLSQRGKNRVDEGSAILESWKEMALRHDAEIKQLRVELDEERRVRREVEDLLDKERAARRQLEDRHREEIAKLHADIAALHRQIIQLNQSTISTMRPGRD